MIEKIFGDVVIGIQINPLKWRIIFKSNGLQFLFIIVRIIE
jgi:hypothetical protein